MSGGAPEGGPILKDRADIEREERARHIRYGLGALAVITVLMFVVGEAMEAPRKGPERLPPAPKTVLFRVTPPLANAWVSLTDSDQVQQVIRPGEPAELELSGEIHWTVQAPGMRARHGRFEVPYGPSSDGPVEVDVALQASVTPSRRRGTLGRIRLGTARRGKR